ncbi:MAG: NIPSNAP family protein [Betaproteobacteria bacterium]
MPRIVEIRSYNLKPGTREEFKRILRTEARPMLARHGTDVVAAGPSLVEADSFFIMRAYRDAADRDASQAAFYGSTAWREGPREAVLACIENYVTIVIEADEATIDGLRDQAREVAA